MQVRLRSNGQLITTRMHELFTHACNNNMLIILASREESLLGCAAAGSKVEGDDRMTLETGGWANISTFPSFFCVSPFSLVSLFVSILSPFPFWFMLLLVVMEGEWSCWSRVENPTCYSRWRQGCSREEELLDVASMEAERDSDFRSATVIAALRGRIWLLLLLHCDIGVALSAGPKRKGCCCNWVLRKTLLCFKVACDWNRWVFGCCFSVVVGSWLREKESCWWEKKTVCGRSKGSVTKKEMKGWYVYV